MRYVPVHRKRDCMSEGLTLYFQLSLKSTSSDQGGGVHLNAGTRFLVGSRNIPCIRPRPLIVQCLQYPFLLWNILILHADSYGLTK